MGEGGGEEGPGEAEEGADDDVLGDFALGGFFDFTEAEDGLRGDQEADGAGLTHEDEEEDEETLQPADVAAATAETGDVAAGDFVGEGMHDARDEETAPGDTEDGAGEDGERGEVVAKVEGEGEMEPPALGNGGGEEEGEKKKECEVEELEEEEGEGAGGRMTLLGGVFEGGEEEDGEEERPMEGAKEEVEESEGDEAGEEDGHGAGALAVGVEEEFGEEVESGEDGECGVNGREGERLGGEMIGVNL